MTHYPVNSSNPVDYEVFWRLLGGMGVTQQRLMDRMGASP
jgi:hypothetical protein